MWRNMASSFIKTLRPGEDDPNKPEVQGRIITTLPKAKELRPYVEKLITLARRARVHSAEADRFATKAEPQSAEWKAWRESDQWQKWNQAIAPVVAARRRAFALLRDKLAVDILFDELAERFENRPGGYTRIVRLATYRLGDAGQHALIEFVGERDRVRARRAAPTLKTEEPVPAAVGASHESAPPAEGTTGG
jgi:large subunit ribosomal protein L17